MILLGDKRIVKQGTSRAAVGDADEARAKELASILTSTCFRTTMPAYPHRLLLRGVVQKAPLRGNPRLGWKIALGECPRDDGNKNYV